MDEVEKIFTESLAERHGFRRLRILMTIDEEELYSAG